MRQFVERRRQSAAGRIAHDSQRVAADLDHSGDEAMQSRRIRNDSSFEGEVLPFRHDGDAVIADGARQDYAIACPRLVG